MSKGIDEATTKIIEPVVNRVIPIALVTTRQLILKDFALEPNAERMVQATESTAQALASQLSQITCKEPLKQSLAKELMEIFRSRVGDKEVENNEQEYKEFIEKLIHENLARGC